MQKCGFDVVIVAGQSNAEGNGKKKDNKEFLSDKVFQIADKNHIGTRVCDDGKVVIDMVYPTEMSFEKACERQDSGGGKIADFSQTFAKCYMDNGLLAAGRKILIVKTAVGGTGFARKEWGVGSVLFERLNYMTDYALSLNKDNRVVAFLWHQGEHDAFENAGLSPEERYAFYYGRFTEQMRRVREKYGSNLPVVTGGFVDSWAELAENKAACDAVEKALKDACRDLRAAGFAESDGLLSNDDAFHTGDNIHFCADSVYELGKRYFAEYLKIVKSKGD